MTADRNGSRPQAIADIGEHPGPPAATPSAVETPSLAASEGGNGAVRAGDANAKGTAGRQEKATRENGSQTARTRRRRRTKQDQALTHLLGGMTITETALTLRVSRSTVHRWLDDPLFRSRYESLRDDLVDSMFDQQLQASFMATSRLVELIDSEDERVAVRAAIALQVAGQRIYYFLDLNKRIERVESNLMLLPRARR